MFEVCSLTASVFFALCKYSTGKGLVTNVNKKAKQNKTNKKKRFNEVLFSACSLSLYGYLRLSPSDCTSLATLLEAVSHNPVITSKLYGLMINIIKMLFK